MTVFNFKVVKSGRYILIAGAFLLLLASIYRVFPLLKDMVGPGEEVALKERKLAKYRQLVHEGGDLKSRLVSLKKTVLQGESGVLTGKTPSLAAADIQDILQSAAEKSQVQIKTVRVLKPEGSTQENYMSIPIQFTITSTVGQLKELLYRIETSPKYLVVKKIKIRVVSRRRLEQIISDITVHGFLRKK